LSGTALIFSSAVLGAAADAPLPLLVEVLVGEGPDMRLSLDANSGTSSSLAARRGEEARGRAAAGLASERLRLIAGAAGLPLRARAPARTRGWLASMLLDARSQHGGIEPGQ
jgi:hypothetical protein